MASRGGWTGGIRARILHGSQYSALIYAGFHQRLQQEGESRPNIPILNMPGKEFLKVFKLEAKSRQLLMSRPASSESPLTSPSPPHLQIWSIFYRTACDIQHVDSETFTSSCERRAFNHM